jgi:hypothetical protein
MDALFVVPEQGPHGDTISTSNPKLAAFKQANYIRNVLGSSYEIISRLDGSYTVSGAGLSPITYTERED